MKKITVVFLTVLALLCFSSCDGMTSSGNGTSDMSEGFTETNGEQASESVQTDTDVSTDTLFSDTSVPAGYLLTYSAALSEAEIDLMVRLVSEEAGRYPYMTQVCLAALILNRTEDAGFPDTVREVIFESGEFPSVSDGKVGLYRGGAKEGTARYTVALRAVTEAISGLDPTGGALYFADADDKDTYVLPMYECGGMIFGR